MDDDEQSCDDSSYSQWQRDVSLAIGLAIAAAVVAGVASVALGSVGDGEAIALVEAVMPTSRFLCSAVMTSSATILALMLTLIGMTISADVKVDDVFFRRLKQIAFYDMLTLIASVTFLLLHTVPITKSDQLPSWWYPTIYYSLVGVSAALGGRSDRNRYDALHGNPWDHQFRWDWQRGPPFGGRARVCRGQGIDGYGLAHN